MHCSIIQYCSEQERYKCGYCKRDDSNYSHGLWAHTMTAADYQNLINRGWRRSGKYCYKPTNDIICCPMYTIRCKALEFKASKSQKKVLKRVNKYLLGNENNSGGDCWRMSNASGDLKMDQGEGREVFVENKIKQQNVDLSKVNFKEKKLKEDATESASSTDKLESTQKVEEIKNKDAGPDPTKALCKKAKLMRRERRLEKLKLKGIDVSTIEDRSKDKEKQVEDFINEVPEDIMKKLEVRLVRTTPPSPQWKTTAKETYNLYVKYQTVIHNDRPEKCTEPKFREFLVESPLLEEYSEDGPTCGYGSFHQQYWLEGKLIAVGVIDILPKCVSSVYFFYDPQYMFLTLGTYGALREIAFTRHLHTQSPELQYYYLGFYIHSCPKMRYKGNYRPSDLLCPETYKWFDIAECIPKLEVSLYSRLDPDLDSTDENHPSESTIKYIPVLYNNEIMLYKDYKEKYGKRRSDVEDLLKYATLVGSNSARKLIMVK
ncbi:arginyl-tRNA--protein transferase 1 [Aricia agestis]|uniref:arginyl-tRNA--protein transferase 1 n=1 Tax=Aricia agestis TaxID=91739 RepID=UPI001C20A634|nr:arginyl-tRNA--protein transferase 1 [Aricia agestis]